MINIDKIYIIHYSKLIERKNNIDAFLDNIKFSNYEYITKYDKEDLTEEIINKYYNPSDEIYNKTIRSIYGVNCIPRPKLNIAELSCAIKHCYTLEKISNSQEEKVLILEDDIIPLENFVNNFNDFLLKTPNDWDIIYPGDGAGLRINRVFINKSINSYKKNHPASKCADSFIITKKLASDIINNFTKFTTVIDWQYSYELYKNQANVYWWEPNIITQGSEKGFYKSELR